MSNSKIPFEIRLKEGNLYGYAVAKPTNTISAKQLTKKAVDYAGVQISPVIAEAIIAAAMQKAKDEVAEGNRVYFPCEDGNSIAFYPIIDESTLRQGDKDSQGNVIEVNEANVAARAASWKIRLGAQVSTNFADITKHAHLHYTGKCKTIAASDNSDNQGNNGGGGSDPDENVIG